MADTVPVPRDLLERLQRCADFFRFDGMADAADQAESLLAAAPQPPTTAEQDAGFLTHELLCEMGFRLQDDWYLANGASRMSEDNHQIIHRDVAAALVAAAKREVA